MSVDFFFKFNIGGMEYFQTVIFNIFLKWIIILSILGKKFYPHAGIIYLKYNRELFENFFMTHSLGITLSL